MSRIFCVVTLLVLSVACTTAVADWYSVVQDAGPYAWWQLNETTGTTAFDAMGNYDGTYTNSPTLGVDGPRPPAFIYMPQDEYAVNFDRTNTEHVILGGLGSFGSNLTATGFTYESWLRTESLVGAMFFGMPATSPNQSQFIQFRLKLAVDLGGHLPGQRAVRPNAGPSPLPPPHSIAGTTPCRGGRRPPCPRGTMPFCPS